MLAVPGKEPFDSDGHYFELKYDGVRALVEVDNGRGVRIVGRSGADYTATFPELAAIQGAVNASRALLDGEIVCILPDGRPDFQQVQRRIHRQSRLKIRQGAQDHPVVFVAFDVLSLLDNDLTASGMRVAAIERKKLLQELVEYGAVARVAPHVEGAGIEFFEHVISRGMEGVIAKRSQGLYWPGKRHADWQKLKGSQDETFVVVGYTQGTGWREDTFGALVLAEATATGELRYVGSVGTGFDNAAIGEVTALLADLPNAACPFREKPYEPKLARWVEPTLSVDIKFHARTNDGLLRFPVFVRTRLDL